MHEGGFRDARFVHRGEHHLGRDRPFGNVIRDVIEEMVLRIFREIVRDDVRMDVDDGQCESLRMSETLRCASSG